MLEVMNDFISEYANTTKEIDEYTKWLMLYNIYLDPDDKSILKRNNIICTADGLLSIRRIYKKYGLSNDFIEEYRKYRKTPIFHFPKEMNGINMSRASIFGDRIDHTLFDLKNYFENKEKGTKIECKLKLSYELPKTSQWLNSFINFSELVTWFGIREIFVDKNDNVYDLESPNGECILYEYKDMYSWDWSETYYENLKKKIEKFETKESD